jgi:hypothetical protein
LRTILVIPILGCLLALFGGGGSDFARTQVPGSPGPSIGIWDESSPLALLLQRSRELELSDEQVRRIEPLRSGLQKDAMRHGAAIQIAELELVELQGRAADSTALEAKLREIETARTTLRLAAIRAMEQARVLLTPAQRQTFDAVQRTWTRPTGIEGAVDPAIRQQIQSAIREQLKDRDVVEVETTQAIVNRLTDLAKLFLFIAGIPLAVLGFLGIRKVSNLFALVRIAQKEIAQKLEHAKQQIDAFDTQASRLMDEYQTRKQEADNLALHYQEIKEDADKAVQEISEATRLVTDEGQKATLEIRMTAAAFRAQPPQPSETEIITSDTGVITIPVVVHVIYRAEGENISDAQIDSQIDVLNQDFRAKNRDISKVPEPFKEFVGDALIEFALATIDPVGSPTNGITRTRTKRRDFTTDDGSKASVKSVVKAWDPDRYLNIWVCTLGAGLLRYSQFPGGPKETDGVVVYNHAFGTTGTAQLPFNKGRSTTGGIGMYLNLRHIWGDTNDCTDSDFVADTPPQKGPNFGKPTFPHKSCPNAPHGDMFMNFMDYVDDDAMCMFTKGQVLRMREALQGPRRKLRIS